MDRPILDQNVTAAQLPSRHYWIIGLVGVLHILLAYALVAGLATRVVESMPNLIMTKVLPSPEIKPLPPPPAPAKLIRPTLPTAPAPVIKIARQTPVKRSIVVRAGPVLLHRRRRHFLFRLARRHPQIRRSNLGRLPGPTPFRLTPTSRAAWMSRVRSFSRSPWTRVEM